MYNEGTGACDGDRCVCVLHEGIGVMGIGVCAEGIWCCRRVSSEMCTFRWLSELKT